MDHLHVQGLSYWAPANIGPYSQSVKALGLLFMAGQIGLVPPTMAMPATMPSTIPGTIPGIDPGADPVTAVTAVTAEARISLRSVENVAVANKTTTDAVFETPRF